MLFKVTLLAFMATAAIASSSKETCPGGLKLCSGTCVSLKSNPLNCGKCGKACKTGQSCKNGKCSGSGGTAQFCNSETFVEAGSCYSIQCNVGYSGGKVLDHSTTTDVYDCAAQCSALDGCVLGVYTVSTSACEFYKTLGTSSPEQGVESAELVSTAQCA